MQKRQERNMTVHVLLVAFHSFSAAFHGFDFRRKGLMQKNYEKSRILWNGCRSKIAIFSWLEFCWNCRNSSLNIVESAESDGIVQVAVFFHLILFSGHTKLQEITTSSL